MTSAEKISGIKTTSDIHEADQPICYNILLQLGLYFGTFSVFIILRKKFSPLFSPNPRKKRIHPAYNKNGYFSWIGPILSMSDLDLININGLDSYVMLSALKMICWIFIILIFLVSIPLCIIYSLESFNFEEIFFSFSRKNNTSNYATYCAFAGVFVITFVILFVLYLYSKSFISLRQAFIRNPATMHPIEIIHKKSVEEINAPSKTVLLTRLPLYLEHNADLSEYVKALGLGETLQCLIIRDTVNYNKLLSKRKSLIIQIEQEIYQTFDQLKHENASHDLSSQEDSNDSGNSLSTLDNEDIKNERKMPHSEKVKFLKAFLNDRRYENIQKVLKRFDKNFEEIKNELQELEGGKNTKNIVEFVKDEVCEDNKHFKSTSGSDESMKTAQNHSDRQENEEKEFEEVLAEQNANPSEYLKSLKHAVYKSPFALGIPYKTRSGIVTFKHQRSASVLCQALISSKLFSCSAEPAPAPNDILYDNLNKSPSLVYINRIISTFLFGLFTLIFFYAVGALAVFLDIDFLEQKIPYLGTFLREHDSYRSTLSGILTPLAYNILMAVSPIFIRLFIRLESNFSVTDDQLSLIRKYSLFLMLNGFLSFLTSSSAHQISGLKDITSILDGLEDGLFNSSVFFTNAIIQKALFGQIMILTSIGAVIGKLFIFFTNRNTLRQRRIIYSSEKIDFGTIYPSIMLIFAICLTYSLLTPIILILGFIFYISCLLVFKTKFIYNFANSTESGGIYFNFAVKYVMYTLMFFQFISAISFLKKNSLLGMILFVLFIITFFLKNALLTSFERATSFYPLSLQEEYFIDSFTRNLLHSRVQFIKNWKSEDDKDIVFLNELGLKTIDSIIAEKYDIDKRKKALLIYETLTEKEGLYIDITVFLELQKRYN